MYGIILFPTAIIEENHSLDAPFDWGITLPKWDLNADEFMWCLKVE